MNKYFPTGLMVVAVAIFLARPGAEALAFVGISASMWAFQHLYPQERPTELEARIEELQGKFEALDKTVLQNAQYSATEFGSIKSAIQMKQLGR